MPFGVVVFLSVGTMFPGNEICASGGIGRLARFRF